LQRVGWSGNGVARRCIDFPPGTGQLSTDATGHFAVKRYLSKSGMVVE
jgi:hypothetical protein